MKKLPKLYTKNEKGRYEEYDIPTLDTDDTLYRKINGKYVPFSMLVGHDLPEGVWLIMRHRSSTEYISGKFLKESMGLDKIGDIKEMPNLAELGGYHKCSNWVCMNIDREEWYRPSSIQDKVNYILGLVWKYCKDTL